MILFFNPKESITINELKSLSEKNLLQKTNALVQEERKISLAILDHLREIDRRRAYASLHYLSLYDYMVKELHYSEASV